MSITVRPSLVILGISAASAFGAPQQRLWHIAPSARPAANNAWLEQTTPNPKGSLLACRVQDRLVIIRPDGTPVSSHAIAEESSICSPVRWVVPGAVVATSYCGEDVINRMQFTNLHSGEKSDPIVGWEYAWNPWNGIAAEARVDDDGRHFKLVIDTENGSRMLIRGSDTMRSPTWVSKTSLLFTQIGDEDSTLFMLDSATNTKMLIRHFPDAFLSECTASGNGKCAVISLRTYNNHWSLYLIDLRSHRMRRLTKNPSRDMISPSFSPDGKEVAHVSCKVGRRGVSNGELHILNLGGLDRKVSLPKNASPTAVAWSKSI